MTLFRAQSSLCCNSDLGKLTNYEFSSSPPPAFTLSGTNKCAGKKPAAGFENQPCAVDGIVQALEQAGTNVTKGYQGTIDATSRPPITDPYWK